jgi:hypothetical protein
MCLHTLQRSRESIPSLDCLTCEHFAHLAIPRMTSWTRSIGRYLCTSGSPTLMLDAVPPDSDTDAFVEPTIGAAWLSFPLSGKHISFDGRQGGAACLMPTSQSHQCVDRHCASVVLSADPVSRVEPSGRWLHGAPESLMAAATAPESTPPGEACQARSANSRETSQSARYPIRPVYIFAATSAWRSEAQGEYQYGGRA